MKNRRLKVSKPKQGSILVFVLVAMIILSTIGGVAAYVANQASATSRRANIERAYQYADGGVSIASDDLNRAFASSPNSLALGLTSDDSFPYALSSALSTVSENCYVRTISSPFVNQTVESQIWLDTADDYNARIVATAITGGATQSARAGVIMSYAFGAAIISTDQGSSDTNAAKSSAQAGNVAIVVQNSNTTYIDGGVLANGSVNYSAAFDDTGIPIYEGLYGTEEEIPNYTDAGSSDQLFDFDRFVAVADEMGTHYDDTDAFKTALAAAPGGVLEGVVVIDVEESAGDWNVSDFPSGVNINGTLVFNFDDEWSATDKLKITCDLNVNPADLSGLVPGDASTYTTGYPPTYIDSTKKASSVDITSYGYVNFSVTDDLPAVMYRTAIADFHGNVNVSGVVYSPVFGEIENKVDGQVQYISGSVIGGGGILYENKKNAISIIVYESTALDRLATADGNGKEFKVVYRE